LTVNAQYRPNIVGVYGLTTSAHSLASQAGLDILQKGGNTVDAAVATAATLNVVVYYMSGLDGNGFISLYWAPENKVYSIAGTGAVPYAVDFSKLSKEELDRGYKSGCVPGLFGAWIQAMQKFGTMSLADVMESAINYAEKGFPITSAWYDWTERFKTTLELFPTTSRVFLPKGKVPAVGEMFYMKDLANTFKKMDLLNKWL
jgi:gamma-glutamyltranspeptidase/glutathione hydrolase